MVLAAERRRQPQLSQHRRAVLGAAVATDRVDRNAEKGDVLHPPRIFPLPGWQTRHPMAKRRKQRRPREKAPTVDYTDPEGNVLTLRETLSAGTVAKIGEPPSAAAASQEDAWRRRSEALFERLAVRWEIAGLPLSDQKMLLGRYRMADPETQRWVRQTIARHLEQYIPDLAG
jgi:hypothetical protein